MTFLDAYEKFQEKANPEQEDKEVSDVMVRPVFGEFMVTLCYDDGSFCEKRQPSKQAAIEFAKQYVDEADIIW